MAKSSTAQKQRGTAPVTPASKWKKTGAVSEATLELPSGNVMRVRRIPLENLIARGLIPNSLLPMMQGALAGKRMDAASEQFTQEQLTDMLELQNSVTIACAVEPAVVAVPDDEDDRDEDTLYTDEVDMQDKAFIFQWAVGGTADAARFRSKFAESVATLGDGEGVGNTPEPDPAHR